MVDAAVTVFRGKLKMELREECSFKKKKLCI